jgi:membrane-bound lytic murein transglycosylase D
MHTVKNSLIILILFLPIFMIASPDDSLKSRQDAETQLLANLDSLAKTYYVQQALKLQTEKPEGNEIEVNDSILSQRLSSIPSVIDLPYNEQVRKYIDYYTTNKTDFIQAMLGLTDYYFPLFEEVFSQYNIPLEFKYLALVESALNPRAVSRAGATGVWQFMYTTGKIYKLEINSYVDERMDPLKSSHAAAQFLKDLYELYGDWTLAMAAYNCGPGNVNKAIRRSKGKTNFWELYYYLPRETRSYVPLYVAATYLMHHYQDHGLQPIKIDLPVFTDTILVKKELRLQDVASVLSLPIELINDLNPQYKINIIPAKEKAYPLRLPASYATQFLSFEDSLYRSAERKTETPDKPVAAKPSYSYSSAYDPPSNAIAIYYTVKSGDNLGYIADWYDVSTSHIRNWNNIRGNLIKPGQKLVIYKDASVAGNYQNINSMSFDQKQGKSGKSSSKTSTTPKKSSTTKYFYYTVKKGDSIWKIAKKFPGVSDQDIIKLNNISNSKGLKPGQKLKIPKK